jgi:Resolvase, N terminal domain
MALIGYARVSTDDQNLALQLDALRSAGCQVAHEDKASGVLSGRKGLAEALKGCAAGDVLVVTDLGARCASSPTCLGQWGSVRRKHSRRDGSPQLPHPRGEPRLHADDVGALQRHSTSVRTAWCMRLTGRVSASPCARMRWSGSGTSTALSTSSSRIRSTARDAAASWCGRWRAIRRNRDHRLSARLVPDSGNEFDRLELVREGADEFQDFRVRPLDAAA